MKGNIGQMMKQAQMMQENMRRMQEQLGTLEVEGQSGSGMVKVTMTCKHEVRRVSIDPSLIGNDREMLEDLLVAAMNDAGRKVEATVQEKMSSLTAGMGLPAGLKLPF
jgi:DNA-binding YbaB/EbfC family protein